MKTKLLWLFFIPALLPACKKNEDIDNTRSYITATIDGKSYSTTNVFITKNPATNDLLFFNSLTPDSISIGFQLTPASPAYQPGTYSFRPGSTTGSLLLSFTIESFNLKPKLTWITGNENNLDYFSIERSGDGINFVTIGNVDAAGNTSSNTNYEFQDNANLNVQKYYYRLKMINVDGSFAFSSLKTYPGWKDYFAYYGEQSLKYRGINGTVQITEHDRTAHIVYGTFFFDIINNAGQTKQIRNGSFKVIY